MSLTQTTDDESSEVVSIYTKYRDMFYHLVREELRYSLGGPNGINDSSVTDEEACESNVKNETYLGLFRMDITSLTSLEDGFMSVSCDIIQRGHKYQGFLQNEAWKSCFVSNDCPELNFIGKVTVLTRVGNRLLLAMHREVVNLLTTCTVDELGSEHLFRLDLQYYDASCPRVRLALDMLVAEPRLAIEELIVDASLSVREAAILNDLPFSSDREDRLESVCDHHKLNSSQRQALLNCVGRRLSLVQGPPGTGKTTLGVAILEALILETLSLETLNLDTLSFETFDTWTGSIVV